MVLVLSLFMLSGTALAHKAHKKKVKPSVGKAVVEEEICKVKAMPGSFMDQGENVGGKDHASSVADVVEIECKQEFAEQKVTFAAEELYTRCNKELSWTVAPEPPTTTGPSFEATLDDDGNATVVLWGGPSCAAGESLITAELNVAPYTTVTTGFTVIPPNKTPEGLIIEPGGEVEGKPGPEATESATTSSVATIVQVEFPPVYAEQYVNINDRELYNRCQEGEKLNWIGPDEETLTLGSFEAGVEKVRLDNDGNAFVVLLAGESCAAGPTLVEASLEKAPYTTLTGTFTVGYPKPSI